MDFEFKTDGCSGGMTVFWKKFFGKAPPWEKCCVTHDRAYWAGGTAEERKVADLKLASCVQDNGHPIWALLMYFAVRAGGHPIFPASWRWGYGWKYSGRYQEAQLHVADVQVGCFFHATRPVSPQNGTVWFNQDSCRYEQFNNGEWLNIVAMLVPIVRKHDFGNIRVVAECSHHNNYGESIQLPDGTYKDPVLQNLLFGVLLSFEAIGLRDYMLHNTEIELLDIYIDGVSVVHLNRNCLNKNEP